MGGDNLAGITLKGVTKTYGSQSVLNDINLDIADGEFLTLVGPSGCGKSTTLRIIAGLETQSTGDVFIDGSTVNETRPSKRDLAMVFQSYALFPNLSVKNNIAFGLKTRKQNKETINHRVNELLELVGLSDHINKFSAQLSGGEQQRVALARALAPSPGLLLLDEPLSALDAKVRQYLRLEIKNLQKKLGVTTIMVTHDQEEALTMADRIILMNKGIIEQEGSPYELYSNPKTSFAANFIGTTNLLEANKISNNQVEINGSTLECNETINENSVTITIRPEDIKINPDTSEKNIFKGIIKELEFLGSHFRGLVEVDFKSQKTNLRCQFSSEYILQNNIKKNNKY